MKKRWLIFIFILIASLAYRLFMDKLMNKETIMCVMIFSPFLHWWVIPYLTHEKIIVPTSSAHLEPGKSKLLRFVFFTLGILILISATGMK